MFAFRFQRPRPSVWAVLGLMALAGPALASGTPAIVPAPIGSFVYNVFQEQADLAKAERLVIYQEDWVQGNAKIKVCAMHHLEQIAEWLASNQKPYIAFPVRVEPTGDGKLDRERQNAITGFLAERGVADAQQRRSPRFALCGRPPG